MILLGIFAIKLPWKQGRGTDPSAGGTKMVIGVLMEITAKPKSEGLLSFLFWIGATAAPWYADRYVHALGMHLSDI